MTLRITAEISVHLLIRYYKIIRSANGFGKDADLFLAITKRYTELLGGSISVESEVGKGTIFSVQIPKDFA